MISRQRVARAELNHTIRVSDDLAADALPYAIFCVDNVPCVANGRMAVIVIAAGNLGPVSEHMPESPDLLTPYHVSIVIEGGPSVVSGIRSDLLECVRGLRQAGCNDPAECKDGDQQVESS